MRRLLIVVVALGVLLSVGCPGKPADPPQDDKNKDEKKEADAALLADAKACVMNLHQLVLARQNWKDNFGQPELPLETKPQPFGPAVYSWRAALLPYLEQDFVYKMMVGGAGEDAAKTPVLVLSLPRYKGTDALTVFRRVVVPGKPLAFIVVESSEQVKWAKPGDELKLEDGKPLPKMGGNFKGGFFALCADGHVRFLPKSLDEMKAREVLLTGKGVEPIKADDKLDDAVKALNLAGD